MSILSAVYTVVKLELKPKQTCLSSQNVFVPINTDFQNLVIQCENSKLASGADTFFVYIETMSALN